MAYCKQSPQDFIKNAFTPQIAVLTTPLAEQYCQKNNLRFIELIQPFSKLGNDVHYKDPTGAVVQLKNLKLTFLDVNARPPQTTLARKYLNTSVSEQPDCKMEKFFLNDYQLDITSSTPWYEAWRETFLKVQYPSDHEYTKHFLSCVMVVSSSEINVLETAAQLVHGLNQMQGNTPGKFPKWFSANILRYFVLVHDMVEGNMDVANDAFCALTTTYGITNVFFLRINSRPLSSTNNEHLPDPWSQFINSNIESKDLTITPETSPYPTRATIPAQQLGSVEPSLNYHPLSPDNEHLNLANSVSEPAPAAKSARSKVHGVCLTTEDVEEVKTFLHDYSNCCLLPYVEKQIIALNDVISNKKGVSRSFISATKRWFNPNKPGASAVAVNNLIYAPDSQELQVRRLGDLYFMFGNYSLAFQTYHLAKRDYNTDQAWLYYAGALEMAALAAFMANESSRKTYDYMEESITTYLNTCKMPQFATRATLLSSECLKHKNLYGEAAHQLIRMTSEESDLRSALFLEQAAFCFLYTKMVRKYAFHMVLAGHRYSKAAQRKHSLRSYKQAHQIYENSGWDLAEDHIYYTIGRQAHNLHCFTEAVNSFARLLKGDSKQSSQQQSIFLKEYLTILGNKLSRDNDAEIPVLALPELNNDSLKLLMGPTPPLTTPGKVPATGVTFTDTETAESTAKWHKLEEIMVTESTAGSPLVFKPMIILYNINNLSRNQPLAIVNEPIQVCVTLVNSLQIVLQMKDIYLLWTFDDDKTKKKVSNTIGSDETNNYDSFVKTHVTKSVLIQTSCKHNVVLSLTPVLTGKITLIGICYTLTSSTTPTDSIFIKGKQLFTNNARNEAKSGVNGVCGSLEIKVIPLAPCLQVMFSSVHADFLCDEVQRVSIDFRNTGTLPLHKLIMATSVPELFCTSSTLSQADTKWRDFNFKTATPAVKEKYLRELHLSHVPLPNNRLEPGESTSLQLFIRAPSRPGACAIDLLIYYENSDAKTQPKYRLVRHEWSLNVQESIKVDVTLQNSFSSSKVEEIAMVLKGTNLNKLHSATTTEVDVLSVALYSKYWSFIDNIVTAKNICLKSQESTHILLKAGRICKEKSQHSSISLIADNKRGNEANRGAYLAFARKSQEMQVNFSSFGDGVEVGCDENEDGVLLVRWVAVIRDAGMRVSEGQTQIPIAVHCNTENVDLIDDFATYKDPANLLEASLIREKLEDVGVEEPKITYTIVFPPLVSHDFRESRLCVVPVKLLVSSIVSDDTLKVVINTLSANNGPAGPNGAHGELFCPYASKNFSWVGSASAVKELKPLSTVNVALKVVVTTPGAFNLGTLIEISCSSKLRNDKPVLQNCQSQSALIVIDKNS